MDLNIFDSGRLLRRSFSCSSVFSLVPSCGFWSANEPSQALHNCRQKNPSFLPHRIHVNANSAQVCVASGSHTFHFLYVFVFSSESFWCWNIFFLVFSTSLVYMCIHLGQSDRPFVLSANFVAFTRQGPRFERAMFFLNNDAFKRNGLRWAFRTARLWWFASRKELVVCRFLLLPSVRFFFTVLNGFQAYLPRPTIHGIIQIYQISLHLPMQYQRP